MTKASSPHPLRPALSLLAALTLTAAFPALARAQAPALAEAKAPPSTWVDPDTGHRVIRLTNEPGSDSFYFNVNGFTPDGTEMAYTTPDGISVLNLKTLATRQVVQGHVHAIVVGQKTPNVYYTKATDDPYFTSLWRTNLDTGVTQKLADLPRRASVATINADETLGAGSYIEGNATDGGAYDGTPAPKTPGSEGRAAFDVPPNKGQMMATRLAAKLPVTMFTVNLQTGQITKLIEHSTDWLNHFQFSPTDPTLLLYCHEGPWQQVDRIWTIRTDGTHNQLVHQRTMENEIAGHEWWGADGKTVFYQLHYPAGMQSSFIASYNVETGERVWLHYTPDATSIHDNSNNDATLFTGDGGKTTPWIFLLRPTIDKDRNTLGKNLIKGGYLEPEKLVNMSNHDYRLEPNPAFTPDQKFIIFRSNMFGKDYAFAVEVAKAPKS